MGTQMLSGDGKVIPVLLIVAIGHAPSYIVKHRLHRVDVGPARSARCIPYQIASSGDALSRPACNLEGVSSERILVVNPLVPMRAL